MNPADLLPKDVSLTVAMTICAIAFVSGTARGFSGFGAALIFMPLALLGVALTAPLFLVAAFNPVTLNACVFALAAVALLNAADLPSAGRCVRTPPGEAP